jgi:hypothetical protein
MLSLQVKADTIIDFDAADYANLSNSGLWDESTTSLKLKYYSETTPFFSDVGATLPNIYGGAYIKSELAYLTTLLCC